MDIAIVGPGAMGCLFAVQLTEAGHDVLLVDKNPKRAQSIQTSGISVEGISGERTVKINICSDTHGQQPRSLVIFCVKAYDTQAACETAAPLIGPDTSVLTLQNGLGNVEILCESFGATKVLGGTTVLGANTIGWGKIHHAGIGETVIGYVDEKGLPKRDAVVELLSSAGLQVQGTDDLVGLLWTKLIVNVGINALTALLKVPNGELLSDKSAHELMHEAVREALLVCRVKKIRLLHEDPIKKVEQVAEFTATNKSSMLQDVLKGSVTEIDFINGAVADQAEKVGLEAPVNRTLHRLVSAQTNLANQRIRD